MTQDDRVQYRKTARTIKINTLTAYSSVYASYMFTYSSLMNHEVFLSSTDRCFTKNFSESAKQRSLIVSPVGFRCYFSKNVRLNACEKIINDSLNNLGFKPIHK